jgi:hypothetical protein
MRVGMIFLWLRAVRQDHPGVRRARPMRSHRRGAGRLGHVAARRHHRQSVLVWSSWWPLRQVRHPESHAICIPQADTAFRPPAKS